MKKRLIHEEIVNDYLSGLSGIKIAEKHQCGLTSVHRILREEGIVCRSASDTAKRYYVNENFFDTINTECKAYALGFATADGHIQLRDIEKQKYSKSFRIGLSKRDDTILYAMLTCMNATYPVNYSGVQTYIAITSDIMCNAILNIWKFPSSEKRLPYYDTDPKLLPHYIRGLLDGDGWLSKTQKNKYELGFCGYRPIIEFIDNVFSDLFNIKSTLHPKKCIWTLQIAAIPKVKRILDWLYEDCHICLERKRSRYLDFLDYHFTDKKPVIGTTRKDNVWLEYNGLTRTQAQWARELKVAPTYIQRSLLRGLSFEEVITKILKKKEGI